MNTNTNICHTLTKTVCTSDNSQKWSNIPSISQKKAPTPFSLSAQQLKGEQKKLGRLKL